MASEFCLSVPLGNNNVGCHLTVVMTLEEQNSLRNTRWDSYFMALEFVTTPIFAITNEKENKQKPQIKKKMKS